MSGFISLLELIVWTGSQLKSQNNLKHSCPIPRHVRVDSRSYPMATQLACCPNKARFLADHHVVYFLKYWRHPLKVTIIGLWISSSASSDYIALYNGNRYCLQSSHNIESPCDVWTLESFFFRGHGHLGRSLQIGIPAISLSNAVNISYPYQNKHHEAQIIPPSFSRVYA